MVGGIQSRLAIAQIIVVRDITTIRLNSRTTGQFTYTNPDLLSDMPEVWRN